MRCSRMAKTTKTQAKRLAKDSMKKLVKLQDFMLFGSNTNHTIGDIEKVRKMVLELRKIAMKM